MLNWWENIKTKNYLVLLKKKNVSRNSSEDDLKCYARGGGCGGGGEGISKCLTETKLTEALKQIGMVWTSANLFINHNLNFIQKNFTLKLKYCFFVCFLVSFLVLVFFFFFSSHWNTFAVLWFQSSTGSITNWHDVSSMLSIVFLATFFYISQTILEFCLAGKLHISFLLKETQEYKFFSVKVIGTWN